MTIKQQKQDEEEYDYDDPRFLIPQEPEKKAPQTYAERRKAQQKKSEEKAINYRIRNRKEYEQEQREEALRVNLIEKSQQEEEESPALKMMKKMGFVPGQGIGKNPTSASEPIPIVMREGKTGVGTQSKKPRIETASEREKRLQNAPLPDVDGYLGRTRSEFEERKIVAQLVRARKTLQDLDRRNGVESWFMWKDPEDAVIEEKRENARKLYQGEPIYTSKSKSELSYATGTSSTVIELDDEVNERDSTVKEEEEEWLAYPPSKRLELSLGYMRNKYNYCSFCGAQYTDPAELVELCPGEKEEDHE